MGLCPVSICQPMFGRKLDHLPHWLLHAAASEREKITRPALQQLLHLRQKALEQVRARGVPDYLEAKRVGCALPGLDDQGISQESRKNREVFHYAVCAKHQNSF